MAFALCSLAQPLLAENDGNNFRALETPVVSPAFECANDQATLPPLLRGLHGWPQAYVQGGYVYLFSHAAYWPSTSHEMNCSSQYPASGACLKSDGTYIPEYEIVYRAPYTQAGMTGHFTRIGYVGPCFTASDPPGDEGAHKTVAYAGRPSIGGNGRFYFFTTRAHVVGAGDWNSGSFDELYMGSVFDPSDRYYAYRWQPILHLSVVNGTSYGFLEPVLASWNTPGQKPFAQLTTSVGTATMWGYVNFGTVPGFPGGWAPIQIVDVTPLSIKRPRWYNSAVYILATDGQWHMANQGTGIIDFVPQDYSAQFSPIFGLSSLYYNPTDHKWYAVGEDPLDSVTPEVGCNRDTSSWGATSVVTALPPNSGTSIFTYDTHTQNSWTTGGAIVDLNGVKYIYRGATENACFNLTQWTPNFIGMEITVETLTGF
ncbi:MAG TPA: hypothetical protein VOA87_02830 [Thermoanaerobaculia bacterium]|nr:hypothetical protein [Thermoanaerobaculia bacterium]